MAKLKSVLPYMTLVSSGVAGKPTIQFSGVNVQIVSGAGKTNATVNGEGNLVIGYDESGGTQTGSHNLVLGHAQSFTSYGGLIAGFNNAALAPYASVSGGQNNTVSAPYASVTGGKEGEASGDWPQ